MGEVLYKDICKDTSSCPPGSFSVHLSSSAGSVSKSMGDNVVCMWVQLMRCHKTVWSYVDTAVAVTVMRLLLCMMRECEVESNAGG